MANKMDYEPETPTEQIRPSAMKLRKGSSVQDPDVRVQEQYAITPLIAARRQTIVLITHRTG